MIHTIENGRFLSLKAETVFEVFQLGQLFQRCKTSAVEVRFVSDDDRDENGMPGIEFAVLNLVLARDEI